jgi:ABC-2 type transport system permease protein
MVGSTGPSFVMEATALTGRSALRAYLSGQNIVLAVIGIPLLIALTFGLGAAAGSPTLGFETMPVALAALGAALALSNIITVTGAYPMAKRIGTPIYTAAPGYGSSRVAATFGTLFGIPLLVTPVIVAAVLTAGAPLAIRAPLLTIGAAMYGLALAWAGVRIAATTGEGKMPELCQVALASKV